MPCIPSSARTDPNRAPAPSETAPLATEEEEESSSQVAAGFCDAVGIGSLVCDLSLIDGQAGAPRRRCRAGRVACTAPWDQERATPRHQREWRASEQRHQSRQQPRPGGHQPTTDRRQVASPWRGAGRASDRSVSQHAVAKQSASGTEWARSRGPN